MSQEPRQRDGHQEVPILSPSHGDGGKLGNCLDELSSLLGRAEMVSPNFQVTGWACLYTNLYKQNTSPGNFHIHPETFLQHAQAGHKMLILT